MPEELSGGLLSTLLVALILSTPSWALAYISYRSRKPTEAAAAKASEAASKLDDLHLEHQRIEFLATEVSRLETELKVAWEATRLSREEKAKCEQIVGQITLERERLRQERNSLQAALNQAHTSFRAGEPPHE